MGMSALDDEVVDVFTDRPFTGNPLAVVFGADGLATEQLQALALEFNLSETIFILPPTTAGVVPVATGRIAVPPFVG
jgi:trans-2,3-dihydro-3-hydroxyanthranilate isomerase